MYIESKEETILGSFLPPEQKPERQNAKSRKTTQGKIGNLISNHHPQMTSEITLELSRKKKGDNSR